MERLQGQKQELLNCASVGEQGVASLKERVWELESSALEQEKVHSQQENTIKQLEQVKRPSLSGGCSALGRVLPQSCLTAIPQHLPENLREASPLQESCLMAIPCCCLFLVTATPSQTAHFAVPSLIKIQVPQQKSFAD